MQRHLHFSSDSETAERFAATLLRDYGVSPVELIAFHAWFDYTTNRVEPKDPGITIGGLFDLADSFGVAVARITGVNAYVNPNPLVDKVRSTPRNELHCIRQGEGIGLADLQFLRWLIIDIDPVCHGSRKGLNATSEEHRACLDLMAEILRQEPQIDEASWYGSSGNGAFLMIRVDDLPITADTRTLVAASVESLARKYRSVGAIIDRGSSDVTKKLAMPGTLKCKGPHTEERPRRWVEIHRLGEPVKPLDLRAWLDANAPEAHRLVLPTDPGFHHPSGQVSPPRRPRQSIAGDLEQARMWLRNRPPAISGQGGRLHTFRTICTVLKGWDLSQGDTLDLILDWNATCKPPWTREALIEKVREADLRPDYQTRGYMRPKARRPRNRGTNPFIGMELEFD